MYSLNSTALESNKYMKIKLHLYEEPAGHQLKPQIREQNVALPHIREDDRACQERLRLIIAPCAKQCQCL